MTVTTTANKIQYLGDGISFEFFYPYMFFEKSDIKLIRSSIDKTFADQELVEGSDYSVVSILSNGHYENATIEFLTPPDSNSRITIHRDIPITQLLDYVEGDNFPAESHEKGLDKLTLLIQQVDASTGLCLKLPESLVGVDTTVRGFSASSVFVSNASGDGIQMLPITPFGVIDISYLLVREYPGIPNGVVVPNYEKELIYDTVGKEYYFAAGATANSWKAFSFKTKSSSGNPLGNLVPAYEGELIYDTVNKEYCFAAGTTANSWKAFSFKIRSNAGNPSGSLLPAYEKELVYDTANKEYYFAAGTTINSWKAFSFKIRNNAGNPSGSLLPAYEKELVYNTADKKYHFATGTTISSWETILTEETQGTGVVGDVWFLRGVTTHPNLSTIVFLQYVYTTTTLDYSTTTGIFTAPSLGLYEFSGQMCYRGWAQPTYDKYIQLVDASDNPVYSVQFALATLTKPSLPGGILPDRIGATFNFPVYLTAGQQVKFKLFAIDGTFSTPNFSYLYIKKIA